MIDEFVKSLITQAPNLAFAALFCFWMMKRIESRDKLLFDLLRQCYGLPPDQPLPTAAKFPAPKYEKRPDDL